EKSLSRLRYTPQRQENRSVCMEKLGKLVSSVRELREHLGRMLSHLERLCRTPHEEPQQCQVVQRLHQASVRWQALPDLERPREVSFRTRKVSSRGPQDAAIADYRRDQRGILHSLDDARSSLGMRHGCLEVTGQPEPVRGVKIQSRLVS